MNGNFYTRTILHIMSWKFIVFLFPSLFFALQNSNPVIVQDVYAQRNVPAKPTNFEQNCFSWRQRQRTYRQLVQVCSPPFPFYEPENHTQIYPKKKIGVYGGVINDELLWCINGIMILLSHSWVSFTSL